MKKSVLFLSLIAFPLSMAQAKEKLVLEPLVSKKDCEQVLVEHKPAADVAYQPGVDIHGKPVMEADITPQVVTAPEVYTFDISVDVAKHLGFAAPVGTLGEAKIGTVSIDKGNVTFNGTPLEGDAMAALKELCAQNKSEKTLK